MSNSTYNRLLEQTSDLICEATAADAALHSGGLIDRSNLQPSVLELYTRYTLASNRLSNVYDQIVQPQKRMLIRKMLDSCLGRLLELKADLVNIDLSDYSYNDSVLLQMKVTPDEAEIQIPQYFLREERDKLEGRRKFIDDTLNALGFTEDEKTGIQMTEQQAVIVIQSHERARQGRLRGQFMKEIKMLKDKVLSEPKVTAEVRISAAIVIQKFWRGYSTRRRIKKIKMEEMLLIGMIPKPFVESKIIQKSEDIKTYRRNIQKEHENAYQQSLVDIENSLRDQHVQKLHESIGDDVRHWIKEYYRKAGKLPDYPSEDAGGSRTLFSRLGTESEISKSTPVSSKESSKKSKEKDKKAKNSEGKPKEDEDSDVLGYKCVNSNFLDEIVTSNEQYEVTWRFKDESENTRQKHYTDMIESEKMQKIEQEIRNIVDDIMRAELELLQAAIDRDRAYKGKKPKKQQKKKVRRSGKKGKKKKEKDLTPDRSTESLFEELIMNGIIKRYPRTPIDSFIGEKSYGADDLLSKGIQPEPCLGDIRNLIKEYCILPLGSDYIHQTAPLIRSVLISGPPGSGKKMLVNAICTEVGAVLFDLTPANIVGKYPGKTGLIMLLHLVHKVSRLLQPAVIWMDGTEKPFVKKIPKTDKTDPKRLKKDLCKVIKSICPEDRVLFIGTSYCPWDAEQKLLQQCFTKYIQIPRPDYGSVSHMWRTTLHRCGALSPNLDVSAISRICDGYTIGAMLNALDSLLTTKRRLQLKVRALNSQELLSPLSRQGPVYAEQDLLADTWRARTPLQRRRQRAEQRRLEMIKEAEELAAK